MIEGLDKEISKHLDKADDFSQSGHTKLAVKELDQAIELLESKEGVEDDLSHSFLVFGCKKIKYELERRLSMKDADEFMDSHKNAFQELADE